MAIRVYDLVRTMLQSDPKTFSRNRYFDALSDRDFAKAKRLTAMLRSIAEETKAADDVVLTFVGDDQVTISYGLQRDRVHTKRKTELTPLEFDLLLEIAPHLEE